MAKPVHRAFFWRPLLRDANDDMVLEAAMSGHADFLVTLNRRDFEPAASQLGIAIVSPQEALALQCYKNEANPHSEVSMNIENGVNDIPGSVIGRLLLDHHNQAIPLPRRVF